MLAVFNTSLDLPPADDIFFMEMQEEVNQSVASDNCASYGMKLLSVPTQDVGDAFATQGYAPSATHKELI